MKVFYLDRSGVKLAAPRVARHPARGPYLRFAHGEEGRGRKLVFFPLGTRDFPAPEGAREGSHVEQLRGIDFRLLPVSEGKAHILIPGIDDGHQLLLWYLEPGFRGSARYRVEGDAHLIAEGYEAQGAAGRMGGAPCPVVLVTGPCVLTWERFGRLYDTPAKWRAIYENGQWLVAPDEPEQCAVEIAFS